MCVCVCVCVCRQYTSLLERIAVAVGMSTLMSEQLSIDEAAREIIDRAQQLCDSAASRDKQALIHTLQHKLKSLKDRLDFKVN